MRVISLCNSQWFMYIHKQNFLHNLKSLIEFYQTLHTHSYLYDKYLLQKRKGKGLILLELFPFVILNGFCICIDNALMCRSTPTTAFDGAI